MNNIFCILLTTYNIPEKTTIYNKVLNWWLDNSKFDIHVVSSHINNFTINDKKNITRVFFHLFEQPHDILLPKWHSHTKTSTSAEELSLNEVYNKFNNNFLKYKYIVKLTGKYRTHNYIKILENITLDFDFARQSPNIIRSGNNFIICNSLNRHCHTETFIIKSELFKQFLETIKQKNCSMESKVLYTLQSNKWNIKVLPKILIPDEYRISRNDGSILTYL